MQNEKIIQEIASMKVQTVSGNPSIWQTTRTLKMSFNNSKYCINLTYGNERFSSQRTIELTPANAKELVAHLQQFISAAEQEQ